MVYVHETVRRSVDMTPAVPWMWSRLLLRRPAGSSTLFKFNLNRGLASSNGETVTKLLARTEEDAALQSMVPFSQGIERGRNTQNQFIRGI